MLNQVNTTYGFNPAKLPGMCTANPTFGPALGNYGNTQQINSAYPNQSGTSAMQVISSMLQQVVNLVATLISGLFQLLGGESLAAKSQGNLQLPLSEVTNQNLNELNLPDMGILSSASNFIDKLGKGAGMFKETLGNIGSLFGFSEKGGLFSSISKLF